MVRIRSLIIVVVTTRAEKKGSKVVDEDPKKILERKPAEDLQLQLEEIEFSCAITCFSLIRFITDHMQDLSAPIIH